MRVRKSTGSEILWKAYDWKGNIWFEADLDIVDFHIKRTTDARVAKRLARVLKAAVRDNSDFLSRWARYRVTTQLEYPIEWGLGSSASLINLVAQWAEACPFTIYFEVENGSAYDIAASASDSPILYQIDGDALHYEEVTFQPPFVDQLFFIYTGHPQSSPEARTAFRQKKVHSDDVRTATELTEALLSANDLPTFEALITEHERLIAKVLQTTPIKEQAFSDYPGAVKSLGAWGGDMLLATGPDWQTVKSYFTDHGMPVVVPYSVLMEGGAKELAPYIESAQTST